MRNELYTTSEIKAWDILCKAGEISDQFSTIGTCGIKEAANKFIALAEKIKNERISALMHVAANPDFYKEPTYEEE